MTTIEGSRVEVKVTPNTKGFYESLRSYLRRVEHNLNVGVDIIPDLDRYRLVTREIEATELEQSVNLIPDNQRIEKALKAQGGKDLQQKIALMPEDKELRRDIDRLSEKAERTFSRATKNGFDIKQSDIRKQVAKLEAAANKADFHWTAELELDTDNAHRDLARLSRAIDVADRMEREVRAAENSIRRLNRQRISPAVKLDVDGLNRQLADYQRTVNDSLTVDPKDRAKLLASLKDIETNVDLQLGEARRRFEEFQDKHDKIEADLDLKTALARAHMMSFTRPRSVEIIARLNTTQAGKILNGMLYGSTGLKGVENQFERLVNLFDKFDTVVPKIAVIGGVLGSVSAGAINLSRSILGVGSSLVTMSKAALAAPAALSGLAAAGYVGYRIYGDLGEKFDVASTALSNLNHELGENSWKEYGDNLYRLADDIAPTLTKGLNGIATEEGKVLNGLIDVARQADNLQWLPTIFERSRQAVSNLSPGLQDLVKGFLNLGDATSQYLPRAATYISDVSTRFADWVTQAERTGAITAAMRKVIEQAGYLKSSIQSVTGILTGLYSGLAESENGIQGFSEALGSANRAVNSFRFQQVLHALGNGAQWAQEAVRGSFSDIGSAAYSLKDTFADALGNAGRIVSSLVSNISRVLSGSKSGLNDFSNGITQGFTKAMDAIGDAAPMFDSLLSMVGQLSKTFGGTFAASLKAAAPLIQSIAKATEAVSKAFSALPAPLQAAIGLYMTFGRAGKSAWNTLKTATLDNVMQMADYSRKLSSMGVTMKGFTPSILDVAAAWGSMQTSAKTAASGVEASGKSIASASTMMDKLKMAGGGAVAALSSMGPAIGVAMGITALTTAYADYTMKAQATETGTNAIKDSLNNVDTSLAATTGHVTELNRQIKELFADKNYGETGLNWLSDWETGFDTAKDAAHELGITTQELADSITDGGNAYEQMHDKLQQIIDDENNYITLDTGTVENNKVKAAEKVLDSLEKQHQAYLDNANATALANGYAEDYASHLDALGESADSVAISIMSADEKMALQNRAMQTAASLTSQLAKAQRTARDSASNYYSTVDSLGQSIEQVNALVANGQTIWDDAANNFNFASEAGRAAQATMDNLGQSAQSYIQALVDAGTSQDDVKAKAEELSGQLAATADSFGLPKSAVEALQEQYSLTPSEIETLFKVKTEESKAALTSYLADYQAAFPDEGRTAIYQSVLEGINSGALTSIEDVQARCDELIKDPYQAKLDVDPLSIDEVAGAVDAANASLRTFATKENVAHLVADDQATAVINTVNATGLLPKDTKLTADDMTSAVIDYVNSRNLDPKTTSLSAEDYATAIIEYVQKQNLLPKDTKLSATDLATTVIANINKQRMADKGFSVNANDNATQIISRVQQLQIADKTFNVTAYYTSAGEKVIGGTIPKNAYATGGRIYGPGSGTSDSIPALLSNGEHVVRAASVKKLDALYGGGFLDYLNKYGKLPTEMPVRHTASFRSQQRAFASGGRVQATFKPDMTININPVVRVALPESQSKPDMHVTQNFNTKIVRPADDMYVAASIMHRNATQMAGRLTR
ncbi:hypothetical protein [Bifidobacterium olomucense]|uniref:Tail measure n=1 Tax=Bifidobacterium olomucense TaxID=2675324 RepID=A0A7Y0HVD5_9BIFI|nr:hypothetical protein [Bifidobacterium sp. DSM 109959]NMM98160.1 Tail measure [Bifidobacterium sp. DSM 109959]